MTSCSQLNSIETKGIIKKINISSLIVEIKINSACSNCSHKKGCALNSDKKTRTIEIPIKENTKHHNIDDIIIVTTSLKTGAKAVILAYLIPFILFILSLFMTTKNGMNELYSGLASMSVIAIYYIVLYVLKDKIKKSIIFSIKD